MSEKLFEEIAKSELKVEFYKEVIHLFTLFKFRFQEESQNISFPKIQRGLQYLVSKRFIASPKTPLNVIESFQLESVWNNFGLSKDEVNPRHFYTACIFENEYSFCLFSSLKSIDLVKENIPPGNRTYLMDATFSMVPQGCFKQHLVIYILYFDEVS